MFCMALHRYCNWCIVVLNSCGLSCGTNPSAGYFAGHNDITGKRGDVEFFWSGLNIFIVGTILVNCAIFQVLQVGIKGSSIKYLEYNFSYKTSACARPLNICSTLKISSCLSVLQSAPCSFANIWSPPDLANMPSHIHCVPLQHNQMIYIECVFICKRSESITNLVS